MRYSLEFAAANCCVCCSRVILLGDLNYRLDITDAEARLLISQQDWDTLFDTDQVRCTTGAVY